MLGGFWGVDYAWLCAVLVGLEQGEEHLALEIVWFGPTKATRGETQNVVTLGAFFITT